MQLEDILYSQGFGTRRICAGLVQQGLVTVNGEACDDSTVPRVDPTGLWFTVQAPRPYHEKAYIHAVPKPAAPSVRRSPPHRPSIYTLLPAPLAPAAPERPGAGRAGRGPAGPGHHRPAAADR